jgi:outer membrane protein
MKKAHLALVAAALAASFALPAIAADNVMVRLRAVRIDTANKSDAIPALGVPSDAIHVSDKTIPEIDISYFLTKNIACELVLTYPQKHDVSVAGLGKIGTFKHLPPTLSVQYHFSPDSTVRPYVGGGINFTNISDVHLAIPGVGTLNLDRKSWGLAFGGGIDFKVSKDLYVNVDVKKVYIDADVTLGGTKVSKVNVDPMLYGVGIGWRF